MNKKRCFFTLSIVCMTFLVLIYFRPKSLIYHVMSNTVSVTYLETYTENGIPENNIMEFQFSINDTEFKDMVKVLSEYTYHNTIVDDSKPINGNTKALILGFKGKTIVFTDTPQICIDDTIYQVGYLGSNKSKSLLDELILTFGVTESQ